MVFPHNINFTFLEKICQYFQIPNRFTYYCIIRHNLIYIDKIEHTFYNSIKLLYGTCGFLIGGFLVNEKEVYRQRIIEMVSKIDNVQILKLIWGFVRRGYKEENAGK